MTTSRVVPVAVIQKRASEDLAANLSSTLDAIEEAAQRGARIICTQELFRSKYFCQSEDYRYFDFAEPIPGPTSRALCAVAKKHKVVVVGSLFEKRAAGLYHNTSVVIDANGELLGLYRKMHIPDDPLFYEKFYFTPGDLGFKAFTTRYATIGVLICWDQWYPEAARITALKGAEVIFFPTAIGWHPGEESAVNTAQHESWELIQRSHAVANGVFVAAPNRVGHETFEGIPGEGIQFWGRSFLCDPRGQVLQRGSSDQEEILIAECDLSQVETQRQHWPFLRDRRIDAYGPITERYLGD
jgi:N-carbamoylputrescine amidase